MWSIGEMKRKGWQNVKKYYWQTFVVVALSSIFVGNRYSSAGAGENVGRRVGSGDSYNPLLHSELPISPVGQVGFFVGFLGVMIIVILLVISAVLLVGIFIGNPIIVGKNRFLMESRGLGRSAGIGKAFWVFSSGHYLNVVKIMFLMDLYTILWTLLLIIPGMIKLYEYGMIPYILAENPEADSKDVFALTKDMMGGSKFRYFLLELSFIGWILLALLLSTVLLNTVPCLGVFANFLGLLLIAPYMEASCAEVYAFLRGSIGGFPFNGFGIPEPEDIYQQVIEGEGE